MPSANILSMCAKNGIPLTWEPEDYMLNIVAQHSYLCIHAVHKQGFLLTQVRTNCLTCSHTEG